MSFRRYAGQLTLVGLMAACNNTTRDPRVDDSPTFGHVAVLADEAFEPVLEDLQFVFNATYPDAQVDVHYLPESELTQAMLADSVRCVFAAFEPGGEQEAYFRTRSLSVHQESVATDAIAVIVSPGSELAAISVDLLQRLLTRQDTVIAGVGGPMTLLFDGSGVARSLVDSLLDGDVQRMKGRVFATSNTIELVERVARDPATLGLLSFSRISDLDDPRCRALRVPVRILPVSAQHTTGPVPPDQGTLKDGSYPLRRKINMIVTEGKSGLGTGFASFVAGHKGQRIILKQGLAPERVPARDVEIVHP